MHKGTIMQRRKTAKAKILSDISAAIKDFRARLDVETVYECVFEIPDLGLWPFPGDDVFECNPGKILLQSLAGHCCQ